MLKDCTRILIFILLIITIVEGAAIDTAECGKTKGCYREPENCDGDACDALITWKNNGNNIDFEMSGKLDYIALGFSKDMQMGDDSIHGCVKQTGASPNIVTYYSTGRSSPGIENFNGISSVNNEMEGSVIRCRFAREKAGNGDKVFDISSGKEYNLLVARGSVSTTNINNHQNNRKSTSEKVDFTKFQNLGGTNQAHGLVKTHALLMTLAWAVLVPVGVFMAAYHKNFIGNKDCCGTKLWFVLHRLLVLAGVTLNIIGFILIFVHVGGYSKFTANFHKAHPILGIIVMVFSVINPVMGMLRPGLDSKHRELFNACHSIVGYLAYSIAFATLMIGTRLNSANTPKFLLWVYFGHCMTYVALSILFRVADHYTKKHTVAVKESNTKEMAMEGKDNEAPPFNASNNSCDHLPKWLRAFKTVLFVILTNFNTAFLIVELRYIFSDDN